jgi:hypothetical protein
MQFKTLKPIFSFYITDRKNGGKTLVLCSPYKLRNYYEGTVITVYNVH